MHLLAHSTLYIYMRFKCVKNTNFVFCIVEPYGEFAIFAEQKNNAEKYFIFSETEF